jgi:hypothetical protein
VAEFAVVFARSARKELLSLDPPVALRVLKGIDALARPRAGERHALSGEGRAARPRARHEGYAADGQAVKNAERVIEEWIETARALGRAIPEPAGKLMYA